MLKYTTFVVLFLHKAWCSIVVDSGSQKYINEYCKETDECPRGTHVMCMYYDPYNDKNGGQACGNFRKISVNAEMQDQILELVNGVRSRLAMGNKEQRKGLQGTILPKAYGMFHIQWDNELATFARVYANQCQLTQDYCRSSKRFKRPTQVMGTVRFTMDWMIIGNPKNQFDQKGLTVNKMKYAIKEAFEGWFALKQVVTVQLIERPQELMNKSWFGQSRLYLNLLGPSTHMGCGMSAYSQYYYNTKELVYNVILIVCNLSHDFFDENGEGPVYQTTRGPNSTEKCGCPPGYTEDEECLCVKETAAAITSSPNDKDCLAEDRSCKASLVLLPIFTVEKAPPIKLAIKPERQRDTEEEIMDLYIPTENNTVNPMAIASDSPQMQSNIGNLMRNLMSEGEQKQVSMLRSNTENVIPNTTISNYIPDQTSPISEELIQVEDPLNGLSFLNEEYNKGNYQTSTSVKPYMYDVRRRYFDKKPVKLSFKSTPIKPRSANYSHPRVKKESVFTKAATFKLPIKNKTLLKQDVAPRKDFTKGKSLIQHYIDLRRHHINETKEKPKSPVDFLKSLADDVSTLEPNLKSAEENISNFNDYLKKLDSTTIMPDKNNISSNKEIENSFKEKHHEIKSNHDELMTLLDKLELETKHIQSNSSEKEMLHAKIRKIYEILIAKTELSTKNPNLVELPKLTSDHDNIAYDHIKFSDRDSHLPLKVESLKHVFASLESHSKGIQENTEKNDVRNDSQNVKKIHGTLDTKTELSTFKPNLIEFPDSELASYHEKLDSDSIKYSDRESHLPLKVESLKYVFGSLESDSKDIHEKIEKNDLSNDSQNEIRPVPTTELNTNKGYDSDKNIYNDNDNIETKYSQIISNRDVPSDENSYPNDKEAVRNRIMFSEAEEKKRIKDSAKKKHLSLNDLEADALSVEIGKFRQGKTDEVGRNIYKPRKFKHFSKTHHVSSNPLMRPIIQSPIMNDEPRHAKSQSDPFYMPDRARFLNGF